MSSLDEIFQRREARSLDDIFRERDESGLLDRFIRGMTPYARTLLTPPLQAGFDPEVAGSRPAVLAGLAKSAVLEPVEALLQLLPVSALPIPGFQPNTASEWVRRLGEGLVTKTEQIAMDAGASPEYIAASYNIGNFAGYTAPVIASVKATQLAFRTSQALGAHIVAGDLVTDFTAGLVFGGLLQPGESEVRIKNMLAESATFGAFRIALMLPLPFRALRHQRAVEMDKSGSFMERLLAIEEGRVVPTVGQRDMGITLDLLNEEGYISTSLQAQDILRQGEGRVVLMQALSDHSVRRGSGAGIHSSLGTLDEAKVRVGEFRQRFPGLRFSLLKQQDGTYSAYFGTQSLKPSEIQGLQKQLLDEGRISGQVLQLGTSEVIYVGRARTAGKIQVRLGTGKPFSVNEKNVTNTPWIKENIPTTPRTDALYKNFATWAREKIQEVANSRSQPSLQQIVDLRQPVNLAPDARRAYDSGGVIAHAEEAGLTGEKAVQAVQFEPQEMTPEIVQQLQISRDPSGRGWLLAQTLNGQLMGHPGVYQTLDEAMMQAQAAGATPAKIVKMTPEGTEMLTDPGQFSELLTPQPVFTGEDLFDMWAKQRGLPASAVDYDALKISSLEQFNKELLADLPQRDREVLEKLQAEQRELLEQAGDLPTSVLAATKGFHLERMDGGRYRIRHVESGWAAAFGNERLAREGLLKVVNPVSDMPSIISGRFHGVQALGDGFPRQHIVHFEDNLQDIELREHGLRRTIRNLRDWAVSIEGKTGLPIFTQGVDRLIQGYDIYINRYDPFAKEILKAWRGIKRPRRDKIVDYWLDAAERQVPVTARFKEMTDRGFSPREASALRRAHAVMELAGETSGIQADRYIRQFYGRVRPFTETNGVFTVQDALGDMDLTPQEAAFWGDLERFGDKVSFEHDPELMMHKYIRGTLWDQDVRPAWDNMNFIVGTGSNPDPLLIKHLPIEQQALIIQKAAPGTTAESPVVPKEIRDTLSEFLTVVRGMPTETQKTIRDTTRAVFRKLGVTVDGRILEETTNMWISMQYGAAMGLRPVQIVRNFTQVLWMQYTRNGNKYIGRGLERAMTQEGYDEAYKEGVLRIHEGGLPNADANFRAMMDHAARAQDGGITSTIVAGAARNWLRFGNLGRSVARSTLIPYSGSDQVSRAWSYFEQKLTTADFLGQYNAGRISWDTFEERGMAFFSRPVKDQFRQIYNHLGEETALRFIGRQASDETNFIYFMGVQPAYNQHPIWRAFGMFTTWPLWAGELYFSRIRNGNARQQAAFWARTLALSAAFANMSIQLGIDMKNWVTPLGMLSPGVGPALEHVHNLSEAVSAPIDRKAGAFQRFSNNLFRMSLPGQAFIRDMQVAGNESDPAMGALTMMLGRPLDLPWSAHWQFDANRPAVPVRPEIQQNFRRPWQPDLNDSFQFQDEPLDMTIQPEARAPSTPRPARVQARFEEDALLAAEELLRLPEEERAAKLQDYRAAGVFPPDFAPTVELRMQQIESMRVHR